MLKNKKGFTLIELVVTIGVLSILAAIAIPAAVSIARSAEESRGKTNAESLETACKVFYSGVTTGQINSSNFTPADGSSMTIHGWGTSMTVREKDADSATIADVLKYNGFGNAMIDGLYYQSAPSGGYYSCNIIYNPDNSITTTAITLNTKISDLNIDTSST